MAAVYNYKEFGGLKKIFNLLDVPSLTHLQDGMYKIMVPGGYFHFYVQGNNPDGIITIMFHGGLKKSEIIPPFIRGRKLQENLNMGPLISFSDPMVEMNSRECRLAWFVGSEECSLPLLIARCIESLVGRDPRKLWFVSGSGGGFASVNISHRVKRSKSLIIWNPQFSIERFTDPPDRLPSFLKIVYPRFSSDNAVQACRTITEETDRDLDLTSIIKNGSKPEQVLIFQNWNDWHVIPHTSYYIKAFGMKQHKPGLFADSTGTKVCWFVELGDGHAVPGSANVTKITRTIYTNQGQKMLDIIGNLKLFPENNQKYWPQDCTSLDLQIGYVLKGNYLTITGLDKGQFGITYQLVIIRDGKIVAKSDFHPDTRWYLGPIQGIVHIRVRDGIGNML